MYTEYDPKEAFIGMGGNASMGKRPSTGHLGGKIPYMGAPEEVYICAEYTIIDFGNTQNGSKTLYTEGVASFTRNIKVKC